MNTAAAAMAGVFGTLTLSLTMMTGRRLGWTSFSYSRWLGCLYTRHPAYTRTRAVGSISHLALGILLGLLYALLFEALGYAGALPGAAIGFFHGALTGVLLPVTDRFHPCVTARQLPRRGLFGTGTGARTPWLWMVGHLLFGIVVGLYYKPFLYIGIG